MTPTAPLSGLRIRTVLFGSEKQAFAGTEVALTPEKYLAIPVIGETSASPPLQKNSLEWTLDPNLLRAAGEDHWDQGGLTIPTYVDFFEEALQPFLRSFRHYYRRTGLFFNLQEDFHTEMARSVVARGKRHAQAQEQFPAKKGTTKQELIKRLTDAREYLFENRFSPLEMEQVARLRACPIPTSSDLSKPFTAKRLTGLRFGCGWRKRENC